MVTGVANEFRKDAVRIALTSGLSRRQVVGDLGVGMSTLNKRVTEHRNTDVVSAEDREFARENKPLRCEIRILKDLSQIRKQSRELFSRLLCCMKAGSFESGVFGYIFPAGKGAENDEGIELTCHGIFPPVAPRVRPKEGTDDEANDTNR